MAKGKLLRWTRLYANGYNLSGDSRTLSSLNKSIGEVDLTGWSQEVRNYVRDWVMEAGIEGYQAILNDTASTGAHSVLKNPSDHDIALLWGSQAEPVVGDLAYFLKASQALSQASFEDKLGVFQASFMPLADWGRNPTAVVLSPESEISSTTNFASVDNGAIIGATSRGWIMQLHIIAQSSGNYAFKIEDSANGSDWLDLASATFTLDGSAIGSETIKSATELVEVRRYIRLVATRTAGDVTPVCVFSRN